MAVGIRNDLLFTLGLLAAIGASVIFALGYVLFKLHEVRPRVDGGLDWKSKAYMCLVIASIFDMTALYILPLSGTFMPININILHVSKCCHWSPSHCFHVTDTKSFIRFYK